MTETFSDAYAQAQDAVDRKQCMDTATACLITKDEGDYLVEWLAHYATMGFDRIVVYDNESSDETPSIVGACAALDPRISLVSWPSVPDRVPQTSAYSHAVHESTTDWIGFFDTDELLVLNQHDSIQDFLSRYSMETGAVAINWLMFGSSGAMHFQDGLQALRFRMGARPDSEYFRIKNRFCKSIARTRCIQDAGIHSVTLKEGRYSNDRNEPVELLNSAKTIAVSHDYAQVNHYIIRSAEEFEAKRKRGHAAHAPGSSDSFGRDIGFWNLHNINEHENSAIDRWSERAAPIRAQFQSAVADATRYFPLPVRDD